MTSPTTRIYKRDQVEQAIAIVSGFAPKHNEQDFAKLRFDLKRLLDQDRKQAREAGTIDIGPWAFHDSGPPGRGIDVNYNSYEAFALLLGLRLLRGGITQATAVDFLVQLRSPISDFHWNTLTLTLKELNPKLTEANRFSRVWDGYLLDDPDQMVYLVALAGEHADGVDRSSADNICYGRRDLMPRLLWISHSKHAAIVLELVNAAHQLAFHLDRTLPRSRGRG